MTTATYILWILQLALQYRALQRARSNDLPLFASVLGIMFSANLLMVPVFIFFRDRYWMADWSNQALEYLGFSILAAYIAGLCLKVRKPSLFVSVALFIVLTAAALDVAVTSESLTLAGKLLDAGVAANALMAAVLGVVWISRKSHQPREWRLIFYGLMFYVCWRGLCVGLWAYDNRVRHLLWVGQIGAMLIWNALPPAIVRLSLGVRAEPTEKILTRVV